MSKVTQFTISMGKTINTGNFQSDRVDYSETVQMEEGDDHAGVFDMALSRCRTNLDATVRKVHK